MLLDVQFRYDHTVYQKLSCKLSSPHPHTRKVRLNIVLCELCEQCSRRYQGSVIVSCAKTKPHPWSKRGLARIGSSMARGGAGFGVRARRELLLETMCKRLPTSISCKAYATPPQGRGTPPWEWSGQYIATIEPATYLGPIESIARSDDFLTILVEGRWINVWSADSKFAFKV